MVVGYIARGAQIAYKAVRFGNQQVVKQWTPIVGKGQASGLGIAIEVGTGIGIWLSDYVRNQEDGGNIVGLPTPVKQRSNYRLRKTRSKNKCPSGSRRFGKGCRPRYR